MNKVGLVLEGGGMRGLYTAGILDYFMEKGLTFPYVIGVSAGTINAVSYVSGQKGRTKKVFVTYAPQPRYMGFGNLIKEGSYFSVDFSYNEIPNKLIPFDYDSFFASQIITKIGVTNCISGEAEFFEKSDFNKNNINDLIRASASLPFISPMVDINNIPYLDGGISSAIPIEQSLKDGNNKNIVIVTRNKGYKKEKSKMSSLAKVAYSKYKNLIKTMEIRHENYNYTLDMIEKLEEKGECLILRPRNPLQVKRIEKDSKKLAELHSEGYKDAEMYYEKVMKFIEK